MAQFDYRYGWLIALSFASPLSIAAGITLGTGGTLNLGDGRISFNCTDLSIASGAQIFLAQGTLAGVHDVGNNGQLNAGNGALDVAGDWRQQGNFAAGTSTVNLADGCDETIATVSGSSIFHNLSATTGAGRRLNFEAGVTQQINNAVTLIGSAGNLLVIRSTAAGQAAFVNLTAPASQNISFVDVADQRATGQVLAPGNPASFDSVNSGNTSGWFITPDDSIFSDQFE